MRPIFVMFKMATEGGAPAVEIPINPFATFTVLPITIQGGISGPDGQAIGRPAAALVSGEKILPVDCIVSVAVARLEAGMREALLAEEEE